MTDNFPIRVYVNKLEHMITFKVRTGIILKIWSPETMKVHKRTNNEMPKEKNNENVPSKIFQEFYIK